jgi:hypothetical protein
MQDRVRTALAVLSLTDGRPQTAQWSLLPFPNSVLHRSDRFSKNAIDWLCAPLVRASVQLTVRIRLLSTISNTSIILLEDVNS